MPTMRHGAWLFALLWGAGTGCDAGGGGNKVGGHGGAGGAGGGGAGSGGGIFVTGTTTGSADGGRPPRCDDAGHCSCINIASLGKPAHYGAGNDNTDAFQTWLDEKSSAKLDLLTARTTLTPALLAGYDVIILQALEDGEFGPFWQFTQGEVDALVAWVNGGGGLISLTGYGGDPGEVDPENQLLAFSGISYAKDDILAQCPGGTPCYCWGNSVPLGGWQPASPISDQLVQVGAFHGRSIVSADGTVVSTDGATKYAVSKEVGKGRVFVFADEWVTYTSQWGAGPTTTNPSDPCYGKSASQVFQVPQFWYNVIKWVAPAAQCFDIDDPSIIK